MPLAPKPQKNRRHQTDKIKSEKPVLLGGNGCIFVQNITKEGFQRKPLLFFYFLSCISLIFEIFDGIQDFFARKLENLGWYS